MNEACQNTDREIWREREGDYFADSIHVTETGSLGINCGGTVIVMPVKEWHALAAAIRPTARDKYPLTVSPAPQMENLCKAMRGWTSYAWKEQAYVDDIQQYFDLVLGGMDAGEALYAVNSGEHKPVGTPPTSER